MFNVHPLRGKSGLGTYDLLRNDYKAFVAGDLTGFQNVYKKAVLSQGNGVMKCVFARMFDCYLLTYLCAAPNDSLIVIFFKFRKVKAVIAPAYLT